MKHDYEAEGAPVGFNEHVARWRTCDCKTCQDIRACVAKRNAARIAGRLAIAMDKGDETYKTIQVGRSLGVPEHEIDALETELYAISVRSAQLYEALEDMGFIDKGAIPGEPGSGET